MTFVLDDTTIDNVTVSSTQNDQLSTAEQQRSSAAHDLVRSQSHSGGTHPQTLESKPALAKETLRVVLAHDWTVGLRGGERVLERIARIVAHRYDVQSLYTMFDTSVPIGPHVDAIPRVVSDVGQLPSAHTARRWLLPMYPRAVGSLSRALTHQNESQPVDLLISTSSAAIKGLRPPVGVPHVCYCHSPARYLWSQQSESATGIASAGLAIAGPALRAWDRRTSRNVTHFVANSTHIQHEIKRHWKRDSTVIHPPVRTTYFTPGSATELSKDAELMRTELPLLEKYLSRPFLLYVAALEPYKRADLAIEASLRANLPLLIAGDGSISRSLRATYADQNTIVFLGKVSDGALRALYRRAHALLFPQIEDFGIIAAEAQACGCPVVARNRGGAVDIIEDCSTGVFFDEPEIEHIVRAIESVPTISREKCTARAQMFDEYRFDNELERVINNALALRG